MGSRDFLSSDPRFKNKREKFYFGFFSSSTSSLLQASVNSTVKLAKRASSQEKPFLPIMGSVGKNPAQKVNISALIDINHITIIYTQIKVTAPPHIPSVEWVQIR